MDQFGTRIQSKSQYFEEEKVANKNRNVSDFSYSCKKSFNIIIGHPLLMNMDIPIDLRLNYPVLSSQNTYFEKSFKKHFDNYHNWLTVQPFTGDTRDRETAAHWLSGNGEQIEPNRLSIVAGGHHALLVCLLATDMQGKAIAVDEFTYSNVKEFAKLLHLSLVPCLGDDKGMMPSAIREQMRKFDLKAIYLMPTLHNPTGIVMPLDRRIEIAALAVNLGLIIIEDDAYGFLEENPPLKFAQLAPEISWSIYSLSKPLAPDIKVAYLVSPLKNVSQANTAIKLSMSNSSAFFSSYVSELISTGELEIIIREKRMEGKRRQLIVLDLLQGIKIKAHANGWHLWVELPAGISSEALNLSLLRAGVEISPAAAFATTGTHDARDFIRISLGGEKDMDRIKRGIDIIKQNIVELLS